MTAAEVFDRGIVAERAYLLGFARRLTHNLADAEDLLQETMLRAIQARHQFRAGSNMRAWLSTILRNLFLSERRRAPFAELSVDQPERTHGDPLLFDEVVGAVQALPEVYRSSVLRCDVEGYQYAEAAQGLGIPEGTVKSRIFRGRRMLQHTLRAYADVA
jgi:RNA polymerase sigma-70 factor (ECF subfamily)